MNGKRWLAVGLAVFVIIATFYFVLGSFQGLPSEETPIATVSPPELFTRESQTMPPDMTTLMPDDGGEQPLPSFRVNLERSPEDAGLIARNAALSAQKYFDAYQATEEYISKNGYLYEMPSQTYITVDVLQTVDGFQPQYDGEDVMILYIRAREAAELFHVDANSDDASLYDGFAVCAAYATGDGYAAAWGDLTADVSKTVLETLLSKYNCSHGQIVRVKSATDEFSSALSVLEASTDMKAPFDVRYMQQDEKYVSVVLSSKQSPLAVREFILERGADGYRISLDNIESFDQKYVGINHALPDLNLDLIPPYSLASQLKYLSSDFTGLLDSIRQSGMITDEDGMPLYISGNDEFVFMEFATGLHLLANSGNSAYEWKIYPVLSYDDAVNRMKELSKLSPPPYFLIKQG